MLVAVAWKRYLFERELEASLLLISLCPQKVCIGATGLHKDLTFFLNSNAD